MPSNMSLRIFALAAFVGALCVVNDAEALPSYGSRVPNGLSVPCPPNLIGDSRGGCNGRGLCIGIGHPNCGGFQSGDRIPGNPPSLLLSSFGDDLKSNGFVWTKELCELDSDGDGYTNGEELGDPCCVWSQGMAEAVLDSVDGFSPSHPGMAEHIPPVGFAYDRSALCGIPEEEVEEEEEMEAEPTPTSIDQYYNPGESRGMMEFRIEPYPIPVTTTTYVNFVFNMPEDAPDFFHVVFGEAIISQPDHLHHFVINGCSSPIEPSKEGLPSERSEADCREIMIGAWAPGSDLFSNDSLDMGVILGRGLGIEAILINVHYTDGVYEDPEKKTYRMATDGVRIHYTTDFRPFTSRRKRLIWVPYGPKEMLVPPNEPRYFLSRTCSVSSSCVDLANEQLRTIASFMGLGDDNLTCSSIKFFCFMGGELGQAIQQLCPETCGFCDETIDGKENPRRPSSYRVTSVNYHAHLLGREMYTTLLRGSDDDANQAQVQASAASATQTKIVATDLESRELWDYNDQASIPLSYDIADSNASNGTTTLAMKGVEIKPGDKIEVTCVYDSTGREEATRFGLSTYNEMCITALSVTFETPISLLEADGENDAVSSAGMIDVLTDIKLRTFACDSDNEGHTSDVQQGILTADEDGRNIWMNHPIEESDMCTFPIQDYRIVDSYISGTSHCPEKEEPTEGDGVSLTSNQRSIFHERRICDDISSPDSIEFLEETIAGYTCVGGTFDDKDSNEEPFFVTEKDCLEVGGGSEYNAYTCAGIEYWIQNEAHLYPDMTHETLEFIRTEWWQPKCCQLKLDKLSNSNMSGTSIRNMDSIALASLVIATIVAMIC